MENYDESVDVDSIDSTERDTFDFEMNDDESYSVPSAGQSSEDVNDASDNGNDDEDAVAGDSEVMFDSITADDIRSMEFATVSEAYDFYYRYGKYHGFAVRKSDSRLRGTKGDKIIAMKQFVCNKHGLREKKHLLRLDRKIEHRRLSRTNCKAKLRVQFKSEKNRYVVSAFEETHNHELTATKFMHLHPLYRKISEADKACKEASKKDGVYEQILDDLMKLKIKYCSNDAPVIGSQKSAVGDPVPVPGKGAPRKKGAPKKIGAPKKTKNQTKAPRRLRTKNTPDERNVELDSVPLTESVSQIDKNKKRKASCNGECSGQKKCSDPPQNCADNVTTTSYMNVTTRQIPPTYATQPVIHTGGQAMYPIYGMPVGENSNSAFGLLQQVMKFAGHQ